jgi:hypothetical protein
MRKLFPSLLILSLFFSCSSENDESLSVPLTRADYKTYEECTNIPRPTDTYVFPVYPGSQEWEALHAKGLDVTKKALEVPKDILYSISTLGLIQTYIDYPFSIGAAYQVYSDFVEGKDGLDICQELMRRDDVASCLLEMYKVVNPIGCDNSAEVRNIYQLVMLMQSLPVFVEQMDIPQMKMVVSTALQKNELYEEANNASLIATLSLLVGRIMLAANYEPMTLLFENSENIRNYLNADLSRSGNTAFVFEEGELEEIISLASDFIK